MEGLGVLAKERFSRNPRQKTCESGFRSLGAHRGYHPTMFRIRLKGERSTRTRDRDICRLYEMRQ